MTAIKRSGVFSACRIWRYTLDRHWNGLSMRRTALFVLLNPSTADEKHDDATNRRGVKFAERWGYNGCVFVNLFAIRTPKPQEMMAAADPIGPENDDWILQRASEAAIIICAWGVHGSFKNRSHYVKGLFGGHKYILHCLGQTKDGEPRHILYLPADLKPVRYEEHENG